MSKPVAWIDEETGCFVYSQYDYEDLDEHGKDGLIPLYTTPQKYCPSENNAAYEKGFIDGMAKQRDSKVQQFVEAYVNKEDGLVCAKCFKPFTEMLTDEEIVEVYKSIHGWDVKIGDKNWIGLARELLRKAQEK